MNNSAVVANQSPTSCDTIDIFCIFPQI